MRRFAKRVGSLLISLLLILTIAPVTVFADGTLALSIESSADSVKRGETFTATVNLNTNPGVIAFMADVSFAKEKLEVVSISIGTTLPNNNTNTVASDANDSGTIRLSLGNDTAASDLTGTGALATITFQAKSDAALGDTDITGTVDADNTVNASLNHVSGTCSPATVTIYKDVDTIAITNLDVPVKNGTPDTAVDVSEGFTVSSVQWFNGSTELTGSDKFAGNTAYTAKVTVAAVSGYNVSDTPTYTINGNAVSGEKVGSNWVLTNTFPETEGKTLVSIAVTNPPTKMTYTYGEDFDPTDMVVTGTYDDASSATIPNADCTFDASELSSVGTGKTVTVTYGGKSDTVTSITVNPKNIAGATINLGAALTYTGSEQTQTVSSVVLDDKTLTAGSDYTVSGNTGTNADDYTLTVSGTGNYTGTATKAFSIAKKPIDVSAYSWSYSAPLTYNDAAQTVTVTKSGTDSDKVTITYTNDATNSNSQQYVGSYVAKAEPTVSDSNYVIAGSIDNLSWSIVAADQSATLVDPTSFNVVRNHTSDLSSKVTGNKGALSFTITSGDAGTISGSTFTADSTKTGNVVISVKALAKDEGGSSAPEYNEQTVGTLTITVIAKPELAGQTHWTTTPAGWTYGDTPATLNSSCDKSPVTGPTYEYRGTGSTTYGPTSTVPTEVGTYTVTAIYEDDDNLYPSDAAAFSITAKDVSGLTVDPIDDQEYTGAAIFPTLTVKDGTKVLEEGTDYTVAYNDTNTNVGTAAGDITGIGNYSGTKTGAVSFNITKKSLALPTVGTNTFTYNGSEQTYTPDGFNANTMTISGNKQTKADTYSATISLKDTANYQWVGGASDPTLSFTIAPKALTLSATVADKTYDGAKTVDPATATVTLVGVVGSDKVVAPAVKSVSDTSSADAGTYPVTVTLANTTLTGADAGNYTLSASTVSANVTVKALSSGDAPVAEGSGTVAATPTDLTSSSKNTYDLTVKPSGSDTVKVVFAMPAGTNASYTFTLKFNGQTYTCKPGEAMNAGLVFELPAGSGVAELTWSAPTGSSSGGMMVINGNGTGTPVNGAATTGSMTVPTSLTGKISKVTVDGKAVSSKNYTVSGSNVTLSEAFMKTLSNGKHTVKVSDGTNTYTVTINVNRVSSAGTGDMGIALYAVLALSSATGAVWVSRKKKEN